MSKKATEFQRKAMSWMYRGKEIFKPLNTGWIDENVACVREWVANIFFYRKGDTTIMVDAGYNYDRLAEKMGWLGIDPKSIHHILITHQDTDHVGAVEADSPGLFRNANLYIGEIENRYLTGEVRRKVIYHLYKLPQVTINNEKVLLHDGAGTLTLTASGSSVFWFPVIHGGTWYTLWTENISLPAILSGSARTAATASFPRWRRIISWLCSHWRSWSGKLRARGLHPLFHHRSHGMDGQFCLCVCPQRQELCSPFKRRVHDPSAPYDAYDESDDTEENCKERFSERRGKMKDSELQIDRSCHVLYSKPCKKEILAKIALHYPEAEWETVWEKVQRQYAVFLSDWRIDLGGKKNFHNGVGGTYDCIAIMCYYDVCRDVTTFREMEEIEENLILPSFRKLRFVDINKPFWKKLMHMAFLRAKAGCDKWHDYEMTVAPYEKNKPIYYEFTACPAAEFAKRFGFADIMPALCNVDYASMELLHARLVRTTTCVDGCRCDYTICGDKDPYVKEHPEYRDENGYRRNKECFYR